MEMVTYRASFHFFTEGAEVVMASVEFDRDPDVTEAPVPDDIDVVRAAAIVWEHDEFRATVRRALDLDLLEDYFACRRAEGTRTRELFRMRRCPEPRLT